MTQHFQTVHIRELEITDGEVMPAAIKKLYGFGSGRSRVHLETLFGQILLERIGHHRLVINN